MCVYSPREFQRVLVSCLAWWSSQMLNPWVAASTKRTMLNTWERANLGDHSHPKEIKVLTIISRKRIRLSAPSTFFPLLLSMTIFVSTTLNLTFFIVDFAYMINCIFLVRSLQTELLLWFSRIKGRVGVLKTRVLILQNLKSARCIRVGKNYHGAKNIHFYHSIAVERFFWKGVFNFEAFIYRCYSFIMRHFNLCAFFFYLPFILKVL